MVAPLPTAEDVSDTVERSPQQRAKQLADVCMRLYQSEGTAIRLPLTTDNPMVVILRAIVGEVKPHRYRIAEPCFTRFVCLVSSDGWLTDGFIC